MPTVLVWNSARNEVAVQPQRSEIRQPRAVSPGKMLHKIARALKGRDSGGFNYDLRIRNLAPLGIVGQIFPGLGALSYRISPRWGCLARGRNKTGSDYGVSIAGQLRTSDRTCTPVPS